MSSEKRVIGNYRLEKRLGRGTFGKVKLGCHLLTGEQVAIKVLEKAKMIDIGDLERVTREIEILKVLKHPHIIQLYEVIDTPKNLYLIMEYASGGEVFDYIVKKGRVTESEAAKFFFQLSSGVQYCHANRVIHRDLKPENLLLDADKNVKIIDFGLSNILRLSNMLKTACGSPCYAAPEMIQGLSYTPAADVWSMGIILYALVCGFLPFEDQSTVLLYQKILSCSYAEPEHAGQDAKDLIRRLLTVDPNQRITIDQVMRHPFITNNESVSRQVISAAAQPKDIVLDEELLHEVSSTTGQTTEQVLRDLEGNEHNERTATYYILVDRKRRHSMGSIGGDQRPLVLPPVSSGPAVSGTATAATTSRSSSVGRVSTADPVTSAQRPPSGHSSNTNSTPPQRRASLSGTTPRKSSPMDVPSRNVRDVAGPSSASPPTNSPLRLSVPSPSRSKTPQGVAPSSPRLPPSPKSPAAPPKAVGKRP
eukprot:gnl/Spiro4/7508_TR3926_c0_g1_i1.p1 gnl/Spiro4/7508_TR3926_c0_g1~~gnl/Spiro4/7508_TR3926_c0_g1_i1.p1  ORF type:complete len:478 (-),score=71.96 gnl/Spiro4/7508_TR3926_c0_g1_i1:79-1512(-)